MMHVQDPLEPHSDTHVQAAALTCRVAMVAAAALASEESGSYAAQEGTVGGADTGPAMTDADPATSHRLSPPQCSPLELPASQLVAQELLGNLACFQVLLLFFRAGMSACTSAADFWCCIIYYYLPSGLGIQPVAPVMQDCH